MDNLAFANIIDDDRDPQQLMQICRKFGKLAGKEYDQLLSAEMMNLRCLIADTYIHANMFADVGGAVLDFIPEQAMRYKSPHQRAAMYAMLLEDNPDMSRNFMRDFKKCTVYICPTDNMTLSMFYGNHEYYQLWKNMSEVLDIPSSDHETIYKTWQSIGTFNTPYSPDCLKYTPLQFKDPTYEIDMNSMPTKHDRALRLTKEIEWHRIKNAHDPSQFKTIDQIEMAKLKVDIERKLVDLSEEDLHLSTNELIDKYRRR